MEKNTIKPRGVIDCPETSCVIYRINAIPVNILEYLFVQVTSATNGELFSYIDEKEDVMYTVWEKSKNTFFIFKNILEKTNVELFTMTVTLGEKARQFQASQVDTFPVNVKFYDGAISFISQDESLKNEFVLRTPFYDHYQLKLDLLDSFFGYGRGFFTMEYQKIFMHFTKSKKGFLEIHTLADGIENKMYSHVLYNGNIIAHIINDSVYRITSQDYDTLVNPMKVSSFKFETLRKISGFWNHENIMISFETSVPQITTKGTESSKNAITLQSSRKSTFKLLLNPIALPGFGVNLSGEIMGITSNPKRIIVAVADIENLISKVSTNISDAPQIDINMEEFIKYPYILDIVED